jgi:hypothetical protein
LLVWETFINPSFAKKYLDGQYDIEENDGGKELVVRRTEI